MQDPLDSFKIAKISVDEHKQLKRAIENLQDALDTGPKFDCKACGKVMFPPLMRGGIFPICDECLENIGKLSKRKQSWMLQ